MTTYFTKFKYALLLTLLSCTSLHSQTGFILGYNGTLLKTTNSGTNWVIKPTSTAQTLWSQYFLNNLTGWIAGGTYSSTAIIIKTTDGGETWFQQYGGTGFWLTGIYFINSQTGFSSGLSGMVLKSINGGSNWSVTDLGNDFFETIIFPDSNTGYMTGWNGAFYKTTNTGSNWFSLASGTTNNLYTAFYTSINTGWISGSGGAIRQTTNGGVNWLPITSGTSVQIFSIYFLSNLGWFVGDNGTIRKSTDGGNTWQSQTSGVTGRLECVNFMNELSGWVVGGDDGTRTLHTTNGGTSWIIRSQEFPQVKYNSVFFFNNPLGIKNENGLIPDNYKLFQNFPNPFNPTTEIYYDVSKAGTVSITVYNSQGIEVRTIINGTHKRGSYKIIFNAENLPSGIYFYKLLSDDYSETKKMIFIK